MAAGNGAVPVTPFTPAPDLASCAISRCKTAARERDTGKKRSPSRVKLNETLTLRRQQYKENQHYVDLKALCESEATIKSWKATARNRGRKTPCPLCGSSEHPAIETYQALALTG